MTKRIDGFINFCISEGITYEIEGLDKYAKDEMPGPKYFPHLVVKPVSTKEVSKIMQYAYDHDLPVTPRGLGTGLSGGALAVNGGVLLSTERMDKILEIDEENMVVVVQPGVITGQLQSAVSSRGLYYPVDPASLNSCSIGGNVVVNAGGARAFKYGVTRNYVTGIEAVLPSGEIVHYGGKIFKNVVGYDISQLIIGSEGTLAIVTEITLRLIPKPLYDLDLLIPFNNMDSAVKAISSIIHNKSMMPAVLEFMEHQGIMACREVLKRELPFPESAVHVIVSLDGNDMDSLYNQAQVIQESLIEFGVVEDILIADEPQMKKNLWSARRELLETLKKISEDVEVEDIVVPKGRIADMIRHIERIAQKHAITLVPWGHIGDGNIHIGILRRGITQQEWFQKVDSVAEELFDVCLSLGGQITAEHGIGLSKKRFMSTAVSSETLELMKSIKKTFDPKNILNPCKIFDFK
ncbi:MAG: FAD-binding protein [Candidatus Magnetoovum sp. WYHC-5]|nr:FAD-binding protein [Candidatus Magnetoovum sp. WYHC-5]